MAPGTAVSTAQTPPYLTGGTLGILVSMGKRGGTGVPVIIMGATLTSTPWVTSR